MENLKELLLEVSEYCDESGVDEEKAGYIVGICIRHFNAINNLAQPDVSGQFSLTELEEKRFKASNPKQITFYFGGGIGVKKEIIDDDGDELDITDYDKW